MPTPGCHQYLEFHTPCCLPLHSHPPWHITVRVRVRVRVYLCVCVCEMDEAQAGFKIAGRNINNLRYADDTTLMAESEEELKSLWMKVKYDSKKNLA